MGAVGGGGGADEEWSVSEGVVVEMSDDGLGEGEWYVEVEEWVKKAKGKKRKSKAMYTVASALLFKTKEEAEAYLRSAGLGNREDGDNGDEGDNGDNGEEGGHGDAYKGGMGESPLPPARRLRTWGQTAAHQGQGRAGSRAGARSRPGAKSGAGARDWG